MWRWMHGLVKWPHRVSKTPHSKPCTQMILESCRLLPESAGWPFNYCPRLLVLSYRANFTCEVGCSTRLSVDPCHRLISLWTIGWTQELYICQAWAGFLGKCNYFLRKFQIQAWSPVPICQSFAACLANYLHFIFQQWILRRFFFFAANPHLCHMTCPE